MKQGMFLRIPEHSMDLSRLWDDAACAEDEDDGSRRHRQYRRSVAISTRALSCEDRGVLYRELQAATSTGLVVERDRCDPTTMNVYVPGPVESEIFSIGIYTGPSPLALSSHPLAANPVVTAAHVTDIPAAFVATRSWCNTKVCGTCSMKCSIGAPTRGASD